jgi:hypothetical protein
MMKTVYLQLQYRVIKPLQQWIRKMVKREDDDDNQFNHPFAIF